jgi:hypothetical protein
MSYLLDDTAPSPDADELALPEGATSLDFLRAVYRSPQQPMPRRMRAAVAACPFEHPKLSVSASFNTGLGSRIERMMEARGLASVIDATPAKDPASE